MPITRKDVAKVLEIPDGASSIVPSAPASRSSARSRKKTNYGDVLNLDRCTSAEFSNFLGEGSSPNIIQSTKELAKSKKDSLALRLKGLVELNETVLNADNVSVPHNDSKEDEIVQKDIVGHSSHSKQLKKNVEDDKQETPTTIQLKEPCTIASKEHKESSSISTTNNASMNLENITESLLDETVPVISNSASQTEEAAVLCICSACKATRTDFIHLLMVGKSPKCEWFTKDGENQSVLNISSTSVATPSEEFVQLYKGSKVMISVITKGKLRGLHSDDPKDYVNVLMDAFYSEVEMANMSAKGRTTGSKVQDDKRDAMYVYLLNKFPKLTQSLMNELINNKCYCARRKCWNATAQGVREPLKKKLRDPTKELAKARTSSKETKKIKEDKLNRNKDGREKKKDSDLQSKKKKHGRRYEDEEKKSSKYKHDKVKTRNKHSSSNETKKRSKQLTPIKKKMPAHGKRHCDEARSPWKEEPLERLKTGGKRPKSLEEIQEMRLKSVEEFSDDLSNTSTPFTKRKLNEKESARKKKKVIDVEDDEDDEDIQDDETEDDEEDEDMKQSNDSSRDSSGTSSTEDN